VTKKSQSTFNWYTAEDILANGSFEESPNPSPEQSHPKPTTTKQGSNNTVTQQNDISKIDWQIVDDILLEEMFNELPILAFEQSRPTLVAFAKRYPNYDEAEPIEIVRAYFRFLTRKNIRLTNFVTESEALEKVATVTPMFYVAKSALEDMGITFDLILERKKVVIDKMNYVGKAESALPLKEEAIIVLNRIGCKINNPKKKKVKFTNPIIIKWFNKTISESLMFQKEQTEEAFECILNKTEQRIKNEFIYLID